jgi:hypothetical protein
VGQVTKDFALQPDDDPAATSKGVIEVAWTPRVRSMLGLLEGVFPSVEAAVDDYQRHLEEKYPGRGSTSR